LILSQNLISNTIKKLLLNLLLASVASCSKGDENNNLNKCKENENIKEIICKWITVMFVDVIIKRIKTNI